MRIISGKFKGRRLNPPGKIHARPTTDMGRESLFNLLNNEIDFTAVHVLDLFAGTGAISIEFLSRGAKSATAVDIHYESKKFIDTVKKQWGLKNLRAVKADVYKIVKKPEGSFDIVFADPPYDDPRYRELPELLLNSGWVKPDGLLIIEHGKDHNFEENPHFAFHRKYGSVNFSFFKPQGLVQNG